MLQLPLHGPPGIGRQQVGDAFGGGVGPVGGGKGVVHIEIAQRRQRLGEGRIVGLFPGVETQVLQQQHVAVPELVHRGASVRTDAVVRERDGGADQAGQGLGQGPKAH